MARRDGSLPTCCAPFAGLPARCGCWWGWVVLALMTCTSSFCTAWGTMLLNTLTIARIYDEYLEHGYTTSYIAATYMFGTLLAAVASPFCGAAIDYAGARVMVPVGILTTASGLLLMSLCPTSQHWTTPVALVATFFLVRGGCKGMLQTYRSTVINQWFARKRGKAVAIISATQQLLVNFGLGQLYGLSLDADGWGWRRANLWAAGLCAFWALPVFLCVFHTPESVGVHPDGHRSYSGLSTVADSGSGGDKKQKAEPPPQYSFTRAQALRTWPVWILAFDNFSCAIIGAGCSQVLLQVLRENGAEGVVDIALHVVIPNGIAQMIQPILAGVARDRGVPPRYIQSLSSFLVALAPFTAPHITGPGLAVLYGFNFGSVWGLKQAVTGTIYADFFGRKHLGAVQSIDSTLNIIGTAIGPLIISLGQEHFGSFGPVLTIIGCFPLLSGTLSLLFLKKPKLPKGARNAPLFEQFMYTTIILPRQAREKHRETLKKSGVFRRRDPSRER
jgi:sugar phosphate permease